MMLNATIQAPGVSRRSFLKNCGALTVLLGAASPAVLAQVPGPAPQDSPQPSGQAAPAPDHVSLSWTADPATTMTVSWRTSVAVTRGQVQFAPAPEGNTAQAPLVDWTAAQTVRAQVQTLCTDQGAMNIHCATLEGLQPGALYAYRVGHGEHWSVPSTLRTMAAGAGEPFKFLLFGDSQSGVADDPNYAPWKQTVHNAYAAHPQAAFFMVVGDHVEVGQSYMHWQGWFEGARGVIDRIPAMSVLGNHETYVNGAEDASKPVFFTSQLSLPANGPTGLTEQAYSFDCGDVHCVVLDSQFAEEEPYVERMLERQAEWLDRDLAATGKKWKLVFFHKTPYYNKFKRANQTLKAVLTPVFDRHHVDVVFNGHDHAYSRTYPMHADTPVATPAQGTVYVVTGRSGAKTYPDLSTKVWNAFFYDPQTEPNYLTVEVAGAALTITAHSQSGGVIDTYTLDKSTGADAPATQLPARSEQTGLVVFGRRVPVADPLAAPQQVEGSWHVPAGALLGALKATVTPREDGSLLAELGDKRIELTADQSQCLVDGQPTTLIRPALARAGQIMLTAQDIQTLTGLAAQYNEPTNLLLFAV